MNDYREILLKEMVPALGCTEPIAIALCAAKARELLGKEPERLHIYCSGNVIKNTQSVVVPNTGGMAGIAAAGAAGCFGGNAALGLEVLTSMTPQAIARAAACIGAGCVQVSHAKGVDNLYIRVVATAGKGQAEATIAGAHNRVTALKKNGQDMMPTADDMAAAQADAAEGFSVDSILAYATALDFDAEAELTARLDKQADDNYAIAREGMDNDWGASVGRTLVETYPDDSRARIRAYAAAGSDARMAGCSRPVVINSGSGNQGMTVSLPPIIYAQDMGVDRDRLRRALVISNLMAIYIKRLIGKLSAFCGVVSAAAAAGAGLAWLQGMEEEQIGSVISNTLLTSGGILCDGAKASCATKISVSLDNALLALEMTKRGRLLPEGQGLCGRTADETIRNVARVAREGMKETDVQILETMLYGCAPRPEAAG